MLKGWKLRTCFFESPVGSVMGTLRNGWLKVDIAYRVSQPIVKDRRDVLVERGLLV